MTSVIEADGIVDFKNQLTVAENAIIEQAIYSNHMVQIIGISSPISQENTTQNVCSNIPSAYRPKNYPVPGSRSFPTDSDIGYGFVHATHGGYINITNSKTTRYGIHFHIEYYI